MGTVSTNCYLNKIPLNIVCIRSGPFKNILYSFLFILNCKDDKYSIFSNIQQDRIYMLMFSCRLNLKYILIQSIYSQNSIINK